MVKKAVGLFFLTLLTTLVAGAPGFGQKLVTIKVRPVFWWMRLYYIGKEKGYFKQPGIEVKSTTFRASAKAMELWCV